MKHTLERLDLIVAFSCNLSCQGCISLSDRLRSGVVAYPELEDSIDNWSRVIDPKIVSIFGGEPTLHPRLFDILFLVRKYWPNTIIRLITNGYLLDNFDSSKWFDFVPFEMQISVHRADHETIINNKILKILKLRSNWHVQKFGGNDHKQIMWSNDNFSLYKSIFKDFIAPYGIDNEIKIYNSDPKKAHSICGTPGCPALYNNRLYKCSAVANAVNINKSFFGNDPGIEITSDLTDFINNIGKPEKICGNCPDLESATIVNHFNKDTVHVRQKNIN